MTTWSSCRCCSATITVISFVRLAIGSRSCALCAASTSPVEALTTSKARASGVGAAALAGPETNPRTTITAAATSSRRIAGNRSRYLTRICWPTWSAFELTPGFSCSIAATVVFDFVAMTPKVSPFWTV